MSERTVEEIQAGIGARWRALGEREVVADYGDRAAEYAALREGCGVIARSWQDLLVLRGDDRNRFLNGLVTCDVKSLEPGRAVYGFFTDAKGHVLADVSIAAVEEALHLALPPGSGAAIANHLEKFVVADRVEIAAATDLMLLDFAGPASRVFLDAERRIPRVPGQGRVESCPVGGPGGFLVGEPAPGPATYTLWSGLDAGLELVAGLAERASPVLCGMDAWEAVLVEDGVPRFGRDFGPDTLPQESGLSEEAVSFTKGCYLGQEIVARVHYRGGVNRVQRGLVFAEPARARSGATVSFDGRAAGRVGSIADSPHMGERVGLALLHRRAAEPGSGVEVEDAGAATVAALPFLPPASPA